MRIVTLWVEKIQLDYQEQCVYDLCFNPDGTQLIIAAGQRVLVYDTTTADSNGGSLLQPLKGHKDVVHCVAYCNDGKRFASGGADKNVIIWSSKLEGILKYSHSDSVQCLSWNEVTGELASCSLTELVFWSAEVKSINKNKVGSRVTCCSWSPDGRFLAIGLTIGAVSVRARGSAEEKVLIERPGGNSTPVWSVSFSTHREDNSDVICVTDWGQIMSFYSLSGKMLGKEVKLGFEPLKVKYMNDGELLLVCGTDKTCFLYTRGGVRLTQIGERHSSWLWAVASHPKQQYIAVGSQDGIVVYYKVVLSTVHGLYKDRYAFRENLTDVIVQNLLTDQKVRIRCNDLVKRIAIYRHLLAVQLPDRIDIYELISSDNTNIRYRKKENLRCRVPCNLIVVCCQHLVLCQEKTLQCLTFSGLKVREWEMDSGIRYIKVIGGPPSRECLLIGLDSGQVCKIFLDNAFPVAVLKIPVAVRNLDLSQSRKKLAVVDDSSQCLVYDLQTKELLYTEKNADSVAWNSSYEDLLCFSGNNTLNIKAENYSLHQQKLAGYVVGFCGSKIFCLHQNAVSTFEVPLSAQMYQYLDKNKFNEAYLIACLGVTENDWKALAHSALECLDFDTAQKAFIRIKDLKYLDLITDFKERIKKGEKNRDVFVGDVYAYKGKYKEAARIFQTNGAENRALNMYTDLRMFDQAQDFIGNNDSVDRKTLLKKKADWAQNINEPRAAAEMYLSAGETMRAVDIMINNSWTDMLLEVGRKFDDEEILRKVVEGFKIAGEITSAAQIYRKLGDEESLIKLYVEDRKWSQAFALVSSNPKYKHLVYLPYAHWLVEKDNFVQAQKAYQNAGHPEEAVKVLHQLTDNAVEEKRFCDASYYYWLLAKHFLSLATSESEELELEKLVSKFRQYDKTASIYYAYNTIHRYLEEPFTSYQPESLFNLARYLMQEVKNVRPPGVSMFAILYALSKQARHLGAYKLARQVFDRMHQLRIPPQFQEYVDTSTLLSRAKPYHDSEDLLVLCYRCSTYNPLMPPQTALPNSCTNCRQPFVHSFVTFEVLPLVEFVLENGLTDAEAVRLLENDPPEAETSAWSQSIDKEVQAMRLNESASTLLDPFTDSMLTFQVSKDEFSPVIVTKQMLEWMDLSSVLVLRYPAPLPFRYFRNLMPELQVASCPHCFKIFHIDDFEMKVLEKGHCPFCKTVEEENQELFDEM